MRIRRCQRSAADCVLKEDSFLRAATVKERDKICEFVVASGASRIARSLTVAARKRPVKVSGTEHQVMTN